MGELAAALHTNSSLHFLNLQDNGMTDEGARSIAAMLSVNRALLGLNLRSNFFSDRAAHCLGEGLAENTTLRTLDLTSHVKSEPRIGLAGIRSLALGVGQHSTLRVLALHIHNAKPDKAAAYFPPSCRVELARPRNGVLIPGKRRRFLWW